MTRCDAEGSRKRRLMTPTSEGFFGRSISLHELIVAQQRLQHNAGALQTINVCGTVQVYPQYAPSRKSEYEDVVGYCSCHKLGGYVKLQRNPLYVKHGKRHIIVHVARAGRSISARGVVRHAGVWSRFPLYWSCNHGSLRWRQLQLVSRSSSPTSHAKMAEYASRKRHGDA